MDAPTVIDVDAHYEPAAGWLDEFPELRDELPRLLPETDPRFELDTPEMFAWFVSDDVLRSAKKGDRMAMDRLVTPAMRMLFDPEIAPQIGYEGASMYSQMTTPADRVRWMDEKGIAHQNLISGGGYTLARAIEDPALGRRALSAVNRWMADHAADHVDRLHPVTCLRFDDLDWVVSEMERMRERGSRAFLISSEPTNGIPPSHPDFDRVWSAATDLGMIALLHIGMSPAMIHPGWANVGDPSVIRLLSVLQPWQSAQVFLAAMVVGGVFERHPKLTVLISELGIDWFARTVHQLDGMSAPGVSPLVLGEYTLPHRPSFYIRRNVRISPLPSPDQSPVELIEDLPEVAVFSSDFPHFEGNADPVQHYAKELASIDKGARAAFLGGNIAASYDLMGDPL